ncbi:hypothetical protein HPG69_005660 [Diceros bicornis minor]|uniref:Uncharacterized protein n=1 Tax=Diceros bicornis minor TaxID=77932 RepID=A0A7J7ET47_DICBM|nr:hypothetical protein HPG69_005660 [Diceros bicornis minor]
MDPAALVEAIMEEVSCPICMTFLRVPMSINCGHSRLSGLWEFPGESENWGYTGPLCQGPVQPRNLWPNWQLTNVLEKVQLLGLHSGMGMKRAVCELHREQLEMFCSKDSLITCEACSQPSEHQTHSVKVETQKQSIMWEFEKYQDYHRKNSHQGGGWKSKSWSLQRPEPVSLELKTDCCVLGLREVLKTYASYLNLEPNTAYSHLIVSKERKCMRYGDTKHKLLENPERFYHYSVVLGSQSISSGQHYWAVEVVDRSEWGLGVCKESVEGGDLFIPPLWILGDKVEEGNEYRAGNNEYMNTPSFPPHQVEVFLDYEAHDISFYNVTVTAPTFSLSPTIPSLGASCPILFLSTALAPTTPLLCPSAPWMERTKRAPIIARGPGISPGLQESWRALPQTRVPLN